MAWPDSWARQLGVLGQAPSIIYRPPGRKKGPITHILKGLSEQACWIVGNGSAAAPERAGVFLGVMVRERGLWLGPQAQPVRGARAGRKLLALS